MLLTRTDRAKQVTNPQTPFTAKTAQIFAIDPVEIHSRGLLIFEIFDSKGMRRDHPSQQGKNYVVSDLKRSQFRRLGLNFLEFGLLSENTLSDQTRTH